MLRTMQKLRQPRGWGGAAAPSQSPPAHIRFSVATRPCRPWCWQDPAPLKTLLFILVPLSPEEEPRAAWGT